VKCGALNTFDYVIGSVWFVLQGMGEMPNKGAEGLWKAKSADATPMHVDRAWVLSDPNYASGYLFATQGAIAQIVRDVTAHAKNGEGSGSGTASGKYHPYAKAFTDQFFAAGGADVLANMSYSFHMEGKHAVVTVTSFRGGFEDLYHFNEHDDPTHAACEAAHFAHSFRTEGEWNEKGFTFEFDIDTKQKPENTAILLTTPGKGQ